MKRKTPRLSFDQTLEQLRAHGFETAPFAGIAGGLLVTKYGIGAVLVSAPQSKDPDASSAAFATPPGVLVKGEVGQLLDRGYQKFIKSSQYEIPATAHQLQTLHTFSEELRQLTGATSLYNLALGTTSDVYRYDRLKGRAADDPEPAQPWNPSGESAEGH
jgi:hypothetical protein